MILYGVYGVRNLNTPFNVTYSEGRLIHSVREIVAKMWSKQTDVCGTLFVEKTSLDTVRCKS